jgi:integrase
VSGSLRPLPPGKRDKGPRWELRAFAGRDPVSGHPRQVSRTFRGGKREARKALDALVAEVAQGKGVGTSATVGSLLDAWMANLQRLGKAQSTLESYDQHVRNHIRPGLGNVKLSRLGVHDVDAYLAGLDEKGLSARTIKLDHSILSAALSQGVAWDWLKENPARHARYRKAEPTEHTITTAQIGQLYSAAAAEDIDMAAAIMVQTLTGCRVGEVVGLRWEDLDPERATLRIERAWVPGKGGQHLTTTKTGKGRRVGIGAVGVDLLERYRQAKEAQVGQRPDGWLVSYDAGSTPMQSKAVGGYVSALANRLGIDATSHTLRHWGSSEMSRRGIDPATAAARSGHTVQVMASTYLHTSDDRGAAAGELMAGVVAEALGETTS